MTGWQEQVGSVRQWIWRGWKIRYTYMESQEKTLSPPLILLHGFGASLGHWRKNLAILAQGRRVYALDLLGFGGSEKAPVDYQVGLWVEQVYDFWYTFIHQPVILVGNSIGSLVGLATADRHREMVTGLVMISLPDPGLRTESLSKLGSLAPKLETILSKIEGFFLSPLLLRPLFHFLKRPAIIQRWASFAYGNPEAVTEELVEIITTPTTDLGAPRAFCLLFQRIGSAQFGPSVKEVLPDIPIPILLIWGQQDRMIPAQLAQPQQFLEYHQNLQFVQLPGGHCLHDECPEEVNSLILGWMEETLGSSFFEQGVAIDPHLS